MHVGPCQPIPPPPPGVVWGCACTCRPWSTSAAVWHRHACTGSFVAYIYPYMLCTHPSCCGTCEGHHQPRAPGLPPQPQKLELGARQPDCAQPSCLEIHASWVCLTRWHPTRSSGPNQITVRLAEITARLTGQVLSGADPQSSPLLSGRRPNHARHASYLHDMNTCPNNQHPQQHSAHLVPILPANQGLPRSWP